MRGHPGTGRNIYMATTRNDSAHLTYLLRLAVNVLGWTSPSLTQDFRALTRHIETVRTLTTRHRGDHTAYGTIAASATAALAYLGRHAADCGFDHVREDFCTLRDLCATYLRSLTREQRIQLASFGGFHHAHLAEENTRPGGDGALVMWLNPVYTANNPDLRKVQDAAHRRYAERYPTLVRADDHLNDAMSDTGNLTVIFA